MSWDQLIAILNERRELKRAADARPPVACPNCGEPLRSSGTGAELYCPFDGWSWPSNAGTAIK